MQEITIFKNYVCSIFLCSKILLMTTSAINEIHPVKEMILNGIVQINCNS